MKRLASSLLVSTGLLVLILTFSASSTRAGGAPSVLVRTTQCGDSAEDDVVLERRFDSDSTRPCSPGVGVPTNRVFPDGTREFFVVPPERPSCSPTSKGRSPKNSGSRGLSAR